MALTGGWSVSLGTILLGACLAPWSPRVWAEGVPETIRTPLPDPNDKGKRAERPPEPPAELKAADLKLMVGERLVYDIRVGGLPAGKAQLIVRKQEPLAENEPEVWTVALETNSSRAMSLYYKVQDWAKSYIDVKGGFSRFYHLQIREKDSKYEELIRFDYDIKVMEAMYERKRPDGEWQKHKNLRLPCKVLDPLSALYYLRSVNFESLRAGQSFYLPICADRKVWNTRIKVVERLEAPEDYGKLKARRCLVIEPEAEFKGLFERKGKMRIWVDLETGIPLKMNVEIPIGPAEVILSEHANSPLNNK